MYVVSIHIKANCQLHKNDIKSFGLYGNFCATMSRRQDSMHKYANTVPFLKVFACLSVPVFVLHRKREKFLKKPLNLHRHTMHGSFKYRVVTIFKRSLCILPNTSHSFTRASPYPQHQLLILVYVIQYNRGSIT